jgi:ubiquitin C-terminal hydrolase
MNSSLQCLSNSEALTRFFLSEKWKNDLNRDNPLGMSGNLADEFYKGVSDRVCVDVGVFCGACVV